MFGMGAASPEKCKVGRRRNNLGFTVVVVVVVVVVAVVGVVNIDP